MNYYIGIDGGGTKTLFGLYDQDGNLLKTHTEGTTHYVQVGYDGVTEILQRGIAVLTEGIEGIVPVGLGLAGYGREMTVRQNLEAAVKKAIGHNQYVLKNDAQIALNGALNGQDGILVIAGTGSIAMSRFDGQDDRCGGWGFSVGDEGSAYWIGKKVLAEFSKQSDGRHKKTALYDLVRETTQIKDDADIITYVNKTLGNKREEIAKLALICAKGASVNDEACLDIYKEVASEISDMINVLARKSQKEKVMVSYTGGVWKGRNYMDETFKQCLDANVEIIEPIQGPIYGAYLYAKGLQ